MPAGDGTGPMGQGPMTGRGAGYCGGYDAPGYVNPAPGWCRGFGRGRGWGRGRGRRYGMGPGWGPPPGWSYPPYAPPMAPEQELEALRTQAQQLEEQLEAINRRIDELTPES